jgi:hypothetical protein
MLSSVAGDAHTTTLLPAPSRSAAFSQSSRAALASAIRQLEARIFVVLN